jgi:murein DD-endopeptidase MepM/ murein hydrolase activator NlpD
MHRALLACALVLCMLLPVAAQAQSGGAAAPGESGGTEYGTPIAPVKKKPRKARLTPPVATQFSVTPATLDAGAPLTFTWRVDGGKRATRARIDLVKGGSRIVAKRLTFGWTKTGRLHERSWTPAVGELPAGAYVVRLHAVDRAGRALVRTATASGKSQLEIVVPPPPPMSGIFPIQGPFGWGGDDARFGNDRGTHSHQGQDLTAAEGTPLVSPVAGSVYWLDYQKGGAGHYIVIRGQDGRDYVYMHLQEGSQLVAKGAIVASGQQIAAVGSTGRSTGPHLHFEIWPDGWYSSKESKPIDPRPDLEAWSAASSRS